ncbi:MAG: hypothetical protein CMJ23_06350, partial [Phycisphaerae bacterium]|nr:hypothetical protein [Phycisphaerae bacterium]
MASHLKSDLPNQGPPAGGRDKMTPTPNLANHQNPNQKSGVRSMLRSPLASVWTPVLGRCPVEPLRPLRHPGD